MVRPYAPYSFSMPILDSLDPFADNIAEQRQSKDATPSFCDRQGRVLVIVATLG